jgi:hypothetical protein
MYKRTAIGHIATTTRRRLATDGGRLTLEERQQLETLRKLEAALAKAESCPRALERAVAAAANRADPEFRAWMAQRRRDLQRDALGRIEARVADAASGRLLLATGRRFLWNETWRLRWTAAVEVGPIVARTFVGRTDTAMSRAQAHGLWVAGLVSVLLAAMRVTPAGPYAVISLAIGVATIVGGGLVLVRMYRAALCGALEGRTDEQARSFGRAMVLAFALSAGAFVSLYMGWYQRWQRWSLEHVGEVGTGDGGLALGFAMIVLLLGWIAFFHWRVSRDTEIVRWERTNSLGVMLLASSLLLALAGMGLGALVRGSAILPPAVALLVFAMMSASIALSLWGSRQKRRAQRTGLLS